MEQGWAGLSAPQKRRHGSGEMEGSKKPDSIIS
jgi:hypothetical protein